MTERFPPRSPICVAPEKYPAKSGSQSWSRREGVAKPTSKVSPTFIVGPVAMPTAALAASRTMYTVCPRLPRWRRWCWSRRRSFGRGAFGSACRPSGSRSRRCWASLRWVGRAVGVGEGLDQAAPAGPELRPGHLVGPRARGHERRPLVRQKRVIAGAGRAAAEPAEPERLPEPAGRSPSRTFRRTTRARSADGARCCGTAPSWR